MGKKGTIMAAKEFVSSDVEVKLKHIFTTQEIEFYVACCEGVVSYKTLTDIADMFGMDQRDTVALLKSLRKRVIKNKIKGLSVPDFTHRRFIPSDDLIRMRKVKNEPIDLSDGILEIPGGDMVTDRLIDARVLIDSLRNELKLARTEERALLKRINSYKELTGSFTKQIQSLPVVDYAPTIHISTKKMTEEVTVLMSDFHINRVVSLLEMEGLNEYNFHIFANRYWFLIQEVINITEDFRRGGRKIEVLNINFLGDILNDIFRDENKETNQFSEVTATLRGAHIIAQGINILMGYFKKVRINCVVGNEGRRTQKKPSKRKYNNNDYICYQYLSAFLSPYIQKDRVELVIPKSPKMVTSVMGRQILLSHGDDIKAWAGIPVYGINRSQLKELKKRMKRGGFDYWNLAHFHTANELNNREIMVNGSLCGSDEYSTNELGYDGPPIQKFYGMNSKYGISWVYDLNLSEARKNSFKYSIDDVDDSLGSWMSSFKNVELKLDYDDNKK